MKSLLGRCALAAVGCCVMGVSSLNCGGTGAHTEPDGVAGVGNTSQGGNGVGGNAEGGTLSGGGQGVGGVVAMGGATTSGGGVTAVGGVAGTPVCPEMGSMVCVTSEQWLTCLEDAGALGGEGGEEPDSCPLPTIGTSCYPGGFVISGPTPSGDDCCFLINYCG